MDIHSQMVRLERASKSSSNQRHGPLWPSQTERRQNADRTQTECSQRVLRTGLGMSCEICCLRVERKRRCHHPWTSGAGVQRVQPINLLLYTNFWDICSRMHLSIYECQKSQASTPFVIIYNEAARQHNRLNTKSLTHGQCLGRIVSHILVRVFTHDV